MHVIHLHIIYLRYAVSQAKTKEKRLACRPTETTNLDQPLNAYDVAAKSCIKSWVWSTLCTKPPSAESAISESEVFQSSQVYSISPQRSQSYGIMLKTITVNAVADIIHTKVVASRCHERFKRRRLRWMDFEDGIYLCGSSGAKPRFQ